VMLAPESPIDVFRFLCIRLCWCDRRERQWLEKLKHQAIAVDLRRATWFSQTCHLQCWTVVQTGRKECRDDSFAESCWQANKDILSLQESHNSILLLSLQIWKGNH
jgi:hypothetical protein